MTPAIDREAVTLMRRGIRIFLQGISKISHAGGGGEVKASGRISHLVGSAWLDELLAGYRRDPGRILTPIADATSNDLVAARDIEFTSICRHHLLPFSGKVHIAYAPRGAITGLSSLGRLVDCLSRRLQIQEDLTREIAGAWDPADPLEENPHPATHQDGGLAVGRQGHTSSRPRASRRSAIRSRVSPHRDTSSMSEGSGRLRLSSNARRPAAFAPA